MTKYCEMVTEPKRIRYCLEKALYLAQSGRPGPCWLDIPLNVQGAYVDSEALAGFDAADYEAGGTGWRQRAKADGEKEPTDDEIFADYPIMEQDYAGKGEKRQSLPEPLQRELLLRVIERIRTAKRPVFCLLYTSPSPRDRG